MGLLLPGLPLAMEAPLAVAAVADCSFLEYFQSWMSNCRPDRLYSAPDCHHYRKRLKNNKSERAFLLCRRPVIGRGIYHLGKGMVNQKPEKILQSPS